jgi:acyl dehydratase
MTAVHGAGHRSSTASGKDVTTMNEPSVSAWPQGAPTVGDTASMSRTVEDVDIAHFTEISGDRNPLHYDAELARRTRFGEIVVQGGVTSAILNAVVAEKLPGPGTVFLETHWRFLAPTRPGDRITGEVEVTSVREDKPITTLATRVVRGDGVVAIDGTAVCWTMALG